MLKAILVDFDGTFVDSLPALWKCYRLFLSRHGIEGGKEEFISLMGPSIDEIVPKLKEKYRLESKIECLLSEYEGIVQAAYASHAIPFPWAVEVLKAQKAKGCRLAIVTSGYPSFIEKVLECHGLSALFDAVFGRRPDEPTKPHPAVYRRALHEFNLSPKETVAIEDSQNGMRSAMLAGIPTIAFTPETDFISSEVSQSGLLQATDWKGVGEMLASWASLP